MKVRRKAKRVAYLLAVMGGNVVKKFSVSSLDETHVQIAELRALIDERHGQLERHEVKRAA